MNRNNFLIHLALAIVLILVAAFAGQLNRWRKQWKSQMRIVHVEEKKRVAMVDGAERSGRPEVLVKFKSGVSRETLESLSSGLNDVIEDRIENAPGWTAVDDLDNASAAEIIAQYSKLPEVEYVEENYEIRIPDSIEEIETVGIEASVRPQDPHFGEQWALLNEGQRGGKQGADIAATTAWSVTTGSEDVVVAVLDSGVDYLHEDLAPNMWKRPASMTPYQDGELGVVDDVNGFNAIDNASDPMDENGHGTHCAGIIGAEGGNDLGIAGVNWKVRIMPLKF
ncbi:MAG TPA: S8 family serine peptidase, partial [Pyrinomonadaceae bacterium]|nr:S8 family serine peptidase [Pyrinomonadaceae bacterium]